MAYIYKSIITAHVIFLPSGLKQILDDNLQHLYKKRPKERLSESNIE